jgi:hypothetical protein
MDRTIDSRTLADGNVLPNIPIQEERKDCMTDQGRLARACRLVVGIEFFNRVHGPRRRHAILDTGAPFSVIPFSLWNGQNLSWTPLGSQMLTFQGQPDPDALKWLGVSCEFGVTHFALVDETNRASRSLRVVGKFVRSPLPARFEKDVILGYNFLMDNRLTLTLNPASRVTLGKLANVVGSLNIP